MVTDNLFLWQSLEIAPGIDILLLLLLITPAHSDSVCGIVSWEKTHNIIHCRKHWQTYCRVSHLYLSLFSFFDLLFSLAEVFSSVCHHSLFGKCWYVNMCCRYLGKQALNALAEAMNFEAGFKGWSLEVFLDSRQFVTKIFFLLFSGDILSLFFIHPCFSFCRILTAVSASICFHCQCKSTRD